MSNDPIESKSCGEIARKLVFDCDLGITEREVLAAVKLVGSITQALQAERSRAMAAEKEPTIDGVKWHDFLSRVQKENEALKYQVKELEVALKELWDNHRSPTKHDYAWNARVSKMVNEALAAKPEGEK